MDSLHSLIRARPGRDSEGLVAFGSLRRVLFRREPDPVEVGRYRLKQRIGAGAGGVVMRAHDPELDRDVAVKLLPPGDAQRQLREARLLAQLSSPHVVAVLDVGLHEVDGQRAVYLAMELVEGASLQTWLGQRDRTWSEALVVLRQAGAGLADAHAAGIVHRDFKPDNVVVGDDGRVRVIDFGLAAQGESARTDTNTRAADPAEATSVGGTPRYMAPEQMDGGAADPRADQFAFCVTCFEALSGRCAYAGRSWDALAAAKASPPTAPPRSGVPRSVFTTIQRGLHPDPARRYASMRELLDALADPTRSRRRVPPLLVGALGIAGVAWLLGSEPAPVCGDDGGDLWEMRRVEALATLVDHDDEPTPALEGGELPWPPRGADTRDDELAGRVDTLLSAYAEQWAAEQRRVCVGTASDERARALACLRRAAAEFDETVESFGTLEADAVAAAAGLTPVASCARTPGPAVPEAIAADVEAEGLRLSRVRSMRRMGRTEEALVLARAVVIAADAVGHPPLQARARRVAGHCAEDAGEFDAARAYRDEAYALATDAGLDRAAAIAAGALTRHCARFGPLPETERWADLAQALLIRAGDETQLRFIVLSHVGQGYGALGSHDASIAAHERALEAGTGNPAVSELDLATEMGNLSTEYILRGEYARARELAEAALEINRRVLGERHFRVANDLNRLVRIDIETGHTDRALEGAERALTISRDALGSNHPTTVSMENALGASLADVERNEDAAEHLRRAVEASKTIPENALGERANALTNLCVVERRLGQLQRALEHCREAVTEGEAAFGANAFAVTAFVTNLASAERGAGNPAAAVRHAQRSLRLFEATAPTHARSIAPAFTLAEAQVELGELVAAERAFERARRLARRHRRAELVLKAAIGLAEVERRRGDERHAGSILEAALAEVGDAEVPASALAEARAKLADYTSVSESGG